MPRPPETITSAGQYHVTRALAVVDYSSTSQDVFFRQRQGFGHDLTFAGVSRSGICITCGRTVDICGLVRSVLIVAMMLPPKPTGLH